MTKNKSPTDQSKFPSKDLFGKCKVGDEVGREDKFTTSNQNNKMLAYFNTLSEQHAEILKNLRNNKEEEEFMGNKNKPPGYKL